MSVISLHVPEYGELWYRQRLLADPNTMSYNNGHGVENGCIDFPEEKWLLDGGNVRQILRVYCA